jgi:hypothetical protein
MEYQENFLYASSEGFGRGWAGRILHPERSHLWAFGFLPGACNERWESGRTNTVKLKEDDPRLFALFLTWLSTGDVRNASEFHDTPNLIPPTAKDSATSSANEIINLSQDDDKEDIQIEQLSQCYVLGEWLQAPKFCDSIMHAMIQNCKIQYTKRRKVAASAAEILSFIFSHTVESSPLRRLVVDNFLKSAPWDHKLMEDHAGINEFYHSLSRESMKSLETKVPPVWPWEKDQCAYHVNSGEAGKSCTCGTAAHTTVTASTVSSFSP